MNLVWCVKWGETSVFDPDLRIVPGGPPSYSVAAVRVFFDEWVAKTFEDVDTRDACSGISDPISTAFGKIESAWGKHKWRNFETSWMNTMAWALSTGKDG